MNIETEITEIKEKLDRLLFIMGEGREKSHAEIERETESIVEKIRLRSERKERKNGKT